MDIESKIACIKEIIINKLPDVCAIYLFGSCSNGMNTPESDIDIAILAKTKLQQVEISGLYQEIWSKITDKIDLVDLFSLNTIFQHEIYLNGKKIYCANQDFVDNFELQIMNKYFDLEIFRKDAVSSYIEARISYARQCDNKQVPVS